jgi:hypothetical protein
VYRVCPRCAVRKQSRSRTTSAPSLINNLQLNFRAATARRASRRVAPEQLHRGSGVLDVARCKALKQRLGPNEVVGSGCDREAGGAVADIQPDVVIACGRERRRGDVSLARVDRRRVGHVEMVRELAEDERLVRAVRDGCAMSASVSVEQDAWRTGLQPTGDAVASEVRPTEFRPAPVWIG